MPYVSAKKPKLPKFTEWLNIEPTINGKKYLHVLLTELSDVPDDFYIISNFLQKSHHIHGMIACSYHLATK